MFLEVLQRRNPRFIDAIVRLHQGGELPTNTFALDLDAIAANASAIASAARSAGVTVLAMTKQIGRNPDACRTIVQAGIAGAVAVDLECGWYAQNAGMRIGHLGHLVQVPAWQVPMGLRLEPTAWTVFSLEQAQAISRSLGDGREQGIYLRVVSPGDRFYRGHEGGFALDDLVATARALEQLPGIRVVGATSFPALLFDSASESLVLTPNASSIARGAQALEDAIGRPMARNMPGTTSIAAIPLLAEAGATEIEPGHGLTGTTPLHSLRDLQEVPAVAYVSEVSHHYDGSAFVIGGGLYRDPVRGDLPTTALVFAPDGSPMGGYDVEMPDPSAIDYYSIIPPAIGKPLPPVGSTVVYGFRVQAFVTRAQTAGVVGTSTSRPRVLGVHAGSGAESFLTRSVQPS